MDVKSRRRDENIGGEKGTETMNEFSQRFIFFLLSSPTPPMFGIYMEIPS